MISPRLVVVAAASLLATATLSPAVWAEDKPGTGDDAQDANKNKKHNENKHNDRQKGDGSGEDRQKHTKPSGFNENKNQIQPNGEGKKFGNGNPAAGQGAFDKLRSATPPPQFKKQPVVKDTTPPPNTFEKPQNQDNKFGRDNKVGRDNKFGKDDKNNNNKFNPADKSNPAFQKHFGDKDKNRGTIEKPVVINPPLNNPATTGFKPKKALSSDDARKRFDMIKGARKEKVEAGGKVVIEEPGRRTIFKQNNKLVIQHDDNERLRRVNPNARFEKGKGGINVSIIDRGNVKIYSETDEHGQLLRRYRRGPDGRDFIMIDNRRRRHGIGKDIAIGAGIGLGVAAGAAILNSMVDVPEPRVHIPREKYIVNYDDASEDDVYDALSAPPIEDYNERYTLDEIRATARLRDRMRRVDLDDINFEFGSWDVDPGEFHKLERIARAMLRVIRRNPNEVFLIEGYTDAVGSPEDNLSLSDRRAESVAEVLSEQFQVPFENLTTQGYGEDFLKVETSAPERINRRVAVRRITPLMSNNDAPPGDTRRSEAPQGAYDDNNRDDRQDAGPQDDRGPGDQGDDGRDQGPGNDGRGNYQYSPYRGDREPN